MRLLIWTRDRGITDDQFRDGDIFQIHPDDWEPGEKEKQRFLAVQIDAVVNEEELLSSEYGVGAGGEPVIRRKRKYGVDYRARLDPETVSAAQDQAASVDVVVGVFTESDIYRKS